MNKRIVGVVGAAAVLAGTIGGLTACSSGPATPQNAAQVLQSDGYTPSSAYTQALQSGLSGGGGNEITSSIAGTNNSGDIQGVVVFDNSADATAGAQGAGSSPGITVNTNGDVVTLTGSVSAWAALG
jgi:hypothetical protein